MSMNDRKSRSKLLLLSFVCVCISACGTIPAAKIGYKDADSSVSFKVVRSVICDKNNLPIVANAVTPTVVHKAGSKDHAIDLSKLRGKFVDSDVKIDFYDDGRLKAVNTTQAGQGEAVLKATVTLAGTILSLTDSDTKKYKAACDFIKAQAGEKALSISYEHEIRVATSDKDKVQMFEPEASSAHYARQVEPAIGGICAKVTGIGSPVAPVTFASTEETRTAPVLNARQPGWVDVIVMSGNQATCTSTALWKGRLEVAQHGQDYTIPIPSPTVFGKLTFGASFSASGALSSLQYASSGSATQIVGGANSLLTIAQGETTAQKVAETKADADLIAQQQRLLSCLADPKACK